ncbi:hypothetical protein K437DRAFT_970 [Tilletiaria anomala UBC 951]|uniref:Uncharacterized protein n=1 Tax=Tilletiaria anomala (strain ATCC 24038 / CBS 436.72 / UBC 951) TaxID=1037660 RepID=A0A066WLQ9_TILAU|nr:uncharacterized protein K437DRAFT_970 [Tilletiaria anomala UBC 951]KDN53533.1 hypothetical protein K437DRAFT_970 [Tilletiaria anomala UBC 951]
MRMRMRMRMREEGAKASTQASFVRSRRNRGGRISSGRGQEGRRGSSVLKRRRCGYNMGREVGLVLLFGLREGWVKSLGLLLYTFLARISLFLMGVAMYSTLIVVGDADANAERTNTDLPIVAQTHASVAPSVLTQREKEHRKP